jgi:hypothetical protein
MKKILCVSALVHAPAWWLGDVVLSPWVISWRLAFGDPWACGDPLAFGDTVT